VADVELSMSCGDEFPFRLSFDPLEFDAKLRSDVDLLSGLFAAKLLVAVPIMHQRT
jgi:hypothetical protein